MRRSAAAICSLIGPSTWTSGASSASRRLESSSAALDRGADVLAAYEDRTARYLNFSGASVIWEQPDTSMDGLIEELLRAGREVVARTKPWEGERPGPPSPGQARINLLTPSGLHFGQGALAALAGDALAGPVIAAATALMQALTRRATAD